MSHIDWQGNPGTTICKGETFEIDDPDRIKTWVDAGYVSVVEEPDVGAKDTPAPISTDKVQEVSITSSHDCVLSRMKARNP